MMRASAPRRVNIGYPWVAIAACSWGTWPAILRATDHIAPVPVVWQSAIMMLVLTTSTATLLRRDRVKRTATVREWAAIGWLGFADAMNVVLFFAAYKTTTVAIAVLTHYLTPIIVALAAPIVLGERFSPRTLGSVALSFAGLVLLLAPWDGSGATSRASDWTGAALGAGSAFFYASNVLVTKRLTGAFSGTELTCYHGVVSSLILLALAIRVPFPDPTAAAFLAVSALGPGALASLLFVWGLRRIPASHASTLTVLEPLVAVLVATIAFGEHLGAAGLVGGAMILVGASLVMLTRVPKDARTH